MERLAAVLNPVLLGIGWPGKSQRVLARDFLVSCSFLEHRVFLFALHACGEATTDFVSSDHACVLKVPSRAGLRGAAEDGWTAVALGALGLGPRKMCMGWGCSGQCLPALCSRGFSSLGWEVVCSRSLQL